MSKLPGNDCKIRKRNKIIPELDFMLEITL